MDHTACNTGLDKHGVRGTRIGLELKSEYYVCTHLQARVYFISSNVHIRGFSADFTIHFTVNNLF